MDGKQRIPAKPTAGGARHPVEVLASRISIADCLDAVSREFKISVHELLSARRSQDVAIPRMVAMWLAREATMLSLPVIGRFIGNRDHTTVMHGIRKIATRRMSDHRFLFLTDMLLLGLRGDAKRLELI